jgi:hypothetical protein
MSSTGISSTGISSTEISSTEISRACQQYATRGADEPDQLIGVPAGELLEWGWLIGALADWLANAPDSTGADAIATEFSRYFAGHPTRHNAVWMLNHIAERIGDLLDGDRGQL